MSETHDQNQKRQTRFAHIARPKARLGTAVNPSIDRASTLLFGRAEAVSYTHLTLPTKA